MWLEGGKTKTNILTTQFQENWNKQVFQATQKTTEGSIKSSYFLNYCQLKSILPWSTDHLHVGDWLRVGTILYPPQTPFYCSISRAGFGNCSLWWPLQFLEEHIITLWSPDHVTVWVWMCIRWKCTRNRDLLAATLIFALSSSFSSSDKIMKVSSLNVTCHCHQVSSYFLGAYSWTYLQRSAAERGSGESWKNNHMRHQHAEYTEQGMHHHLPVWLQALCRGDGLGPKPLRQATLSWSDVAPWPPHSPVAITGWISIHGWHLCLCALTVWVMHAFKNRQSVREKAFTALFFFGRGGYRMICVLLENHHRLARDWHRIISTTPHTAPRTDTPPMILMFPGH